MVLPEKHRTAMRGGGALGPQGMVIVRVSVLSHSSWHQVQVEASRRQVEMGTGSQKAELQILQSFVPR